VLTAQRRLHGAIECYRRALRYRPDYAKAHNNLGTALLALQEPDTAAACFRAAIRLVPEFAGAHYNLGNALAALGDIDAAIGSYETALRYKPDFDDPRSRLAELRGAHLAPAAQGGFTDS
jgi:protein O-GlcNAc transferase